MADRVLALDGGRIIDRSALTSAAQVADPGVTVDLRPPAGPVDVAPLADVVARSTLDSSITDRRLTVVVARSAVDRLLTQALHAGWSVLSVAPSDTAPPERSP
jgi:hypothetical protein